MNAFPSIFELGILVDMLFGVGNVLNWTPSECPVTTKAFVASSLVLSFIMQTYELFIANHNPAQEAVVNPC